MNTERSYKFCGNRREQQTCKTFTKLFDLFRRTIADSNSSDKIFDINLRMQNKAEVLYGVRQTNQNELWLVPNTQILYLFLLTDVQICTRVMINENSLSEVNTQSGVAFRKKAARRFEKCDKEREIRTMCTNKQPCHNCQKLFRKNQLWQQGCLRERIEKFLQERGGDSCAYLAENSVMFHFPLRFKSQISQIFSD